MDLSGSELTLRSQLSRDGLDQVMVNVHQRIGSTLHVAEALGKLLDWLVGQKILGRL